MAYLNRFSRNRCTTVDQPDPDSLRSCCSLKDSLTEAEATVVIHLPDLNIIQAEARFKRSPFADQPDPGPILEKIIGVRVGPGMLKILRGLIGTEPEDAVLRGLIEECCEAFILSMTKGVLERAPREPNESGPFFAKMVRKHIRLYDQCAAYRKDSPLTEGMAPPEK